MDIIFNLTFGYFIAKCSDKDVEVSLVANHLQFFILFFFPRKPLSGRNMAKNLDVEPSDA